MNQIGVTIKIWTILIVITVVLNLSPTVFGHTVNSSYARAEYVHEPYPSQSPNTNTTQSHIWLNSQTITWPGEWMWAAASITKPASGQDSHTDNIYPAEVRLMRAGWMKKKDAAWNNGNSSYVIAAFINDDNVVVIAKYLPITGGTVYKVRKPPILLAPDHWIFELYIPSSSSWTTIYAIGSYGADFDGITGNLKCVTFGTWAIGSHLDMGTTQFQYPHYRSTVTGGTYNPVPLNSASRHAAVHTAYGLYFEESNSYFHVYDQ